MVRPHGSSVRRARVVAVLLPVEQALPLLTRCRALGADGSGRASAGTAFWGTAAMLGLQLLARGRMLPGVSPEGFDAWRAGPLDTEDRERLASLAAAMPPEARAVAVPGLSPSRFRRPSRCCGPSWTPWPIPSPALPPPAR